MRLCWAHSQVRMLNLCWMLAVSVSWESPPPTLLPLSRDECVCVCVSVCVSPSLPLCSPRLPSRDHRNSDELISSLYREGTYRNYKARPPAWVCWQPAAGAIKQIEENKNK